MHIALIIYRCLRYCSCRPLLQLVCLRRNNNSSLFSKTCPKIRAQLANAAHMLHLYMHIVFIFFILYIYYIFFFSSTVVCLCYDDKKKNTHFFHAGEFCENFTGYHEVWKVCKMIVLPSSRIQR